ncbi:hypothetical protein BJ508DRAFT_15920 [Ascobolus immersus RN42]|uniref:Uncharacterized protein n=1 Tax=Ascobolus immersus RN42 TaxID=1160509 RepID=A0A3N4HPU3_ASCIM|nr:hypothetical protein BJ508DRAFT_15920 [Ascobolus immersus RN42]
MGILDGWGWAERERATPKRIEGEIQKEEETGDKISEDWDWVDSPGSQASVARNELRDMNATATEPSEGWYWEDEHGVLREVAQEDIREAGSEEKVSETTKQGPGQAMSIEVISEAGERTITRERRRSWGSFEDDGNWPSLAEANGKPGEGAWERRKILKLSTEEQGKIIFICLMQDKHYHKTKSWIGSETVMKLYGSSFEKCREPGRQEQQSLDDGYGK